MKTLNLYLVHTKPDAGGGYPRQWYRCFRPGQAKARYYYGLRAAGWRVPYTKILCRVDGPGTRIRPAQDEDQRRTLEIIRHAVGLDRYGYNRAGNTDWSRTRFMTMRNDRDYTMCMTLCEATDSRPQLMIMKGAGMLAEGMVCFMMRTEAKEYLEKHLGVDHLETVDGRSDNGELLRG